MTTHTDIDKLIQQTRQYEFSDGLREFQLAVFFALSSIAVWLSFELAWITFVGKMMHKFGRWAGWINMLPMVVALIAVWGMLRLMDSLRRRWLWRGSGIVKSSRWLVTRRVNVLSTVIFIGGIGLGVGLCSLGRADDFFVLRMLWAATGWSFGYTLVGVGRHIGLSRYVWLGVVGGLASTVILFLPLNFSQSALVFGLSWSPLLTMSGAMALRRLMLASKEVQI
jgi:hypothetical protein